MADINRRWVLASRPVGPIKDEDFRLEEAPIPELGRTRLLVRVTHLSFDPTQRGWISEDTYLPAVKIGEVVRAGGAGQVVASNNPRFKPGQLVQGAFGWQDYCVTDGGGFWPMTALFPGIAPEQALGVFGVTGITAWFGLHEIASRSPATRCSSPARRRDGIGRGPGRQGDGMHGDRRRRRAGQVRWVVQEAGFDACIDYKSEPVAKRIKALAPKGVNVIFENVGGEILDAGLANLAQGARVILCGGISSYNAASAAEIPGLKNYMALTINRARMEGFIVLDYGPRFGEAVMGLAKLMQEGRLKALDDVQAGIENCPATLRRLFEGKNFGKQLLKLADPPLPVAA